MVNIPIETGRDDLRWILLMASLSPQNFIGLDTIWNMVLASKTGFRSDGRSAL